MLSDEEEYSKIPYVDIIKEDFKLLPAQICASKVKSSKLSKPISSFDLLNPLEGKESISLPQSHMIKDILDITHDHVTAQHRLEPGWTTPVSLEKDLGTNMKFYKPHADNFPASIRKLDTDASKLELYMSGSLPVSNMFLKALECQAGNVISINSYADHFAAAAFSSLSSENMDANLLRRLVESLVNCVKHSTNLSVFMAMELLLTRRELAISNSKILSKPAKDSLRSVSLSADTLFGGKLSEVQKVNSESYTQKFIAQFMSQNSKSIFSFKIQNLDPKKNESKKETFNKHQKDCFWKQRTYHGLENGSLAFIETLHKQKPFPPSNRGNSNRPPLGGISTGSLKQAPSRGGASNTRRQ